MGDIMYIADLHIHSKYSRATSRDCDVPHLDLWARCKGIGLLGAGDFTHPAWREEMKEALVPAEEGLYTLKEEFRLPAQVDAPAPRFVISGEISCIYKQGGKTRKVHNVILLPGLEEAELLSTRLAAIGNIRSDGRPILGLSSRDLLEITLSACPEAIFIPAHIWTPHFSVLGAFSAYESIKDCYGDLTPYIHALETGLSSDPPMNWRVSGLDSFTLVSNSDAHSPQKIGREANVLSAELSYPGLKHALSSGKGFLGTLEFFPEEGKYHLDGHRNCGICLTPEETRSLGGRCPVCGRKLTVGVLHRVEELADREEGFRPQCAKPFESLASLPEVLGASLSCSPESKKVQTAYFRLLGELGSEMTILREAPVEDIERAAGPILAEGIRRLRTGRVDREAGFDGQYGKVSLFDPAELEELKGQTALFDLTKPKTKKSIHVVEQAAIPQVEIVAPATAATLNAEQLSAVTAEEAVVAVSAGPGAGKTKTLISRIAWLIREKGIKPFEITAVTFTNQAAGELRSRIEEQLGKGKARGITIGTFHAIARELLPQKTLLGEAECRELLRGILTAKNEKLSPRKCAELISLVKRGESPKDAGLDPEIYEEYASQLNALDARDLNDLLLDALALDISGEKRFRYLLVDEFQDLDPVQHALIHRWSEHSDGLFVIGDADQSIYGFRGADAACFEKLQRAHSGTREIALKENYRSTPEILAAALCSIRHNPGGERPLHANRSSGAPVRAVRADNAFSEAVFIAKEIARMTGGFDMLTASSGERMRDTVRPFSEIAVLARTRRELMLIESCLRHDSIPCVLFGREEAFEADSARAAIGFFQSLLNIQDALSLKLCLQLQWNCPMDLIEKAVRLVSAMDAWDVGSLRRELHPFAHFEGWLCALEQFLLLVEKEKPKKLLDRWCGFAGEDPALQKLTGAASFHDTMEGFLSALKLGQEADLRISSGKARIGGAVSLMTLHGAKGLEFPAVFLAGVNKDGLPLKHEGEETDVEEERRLFFVGMTRAKEELILTCTEPSEFLVEIESQVLWEKAGVRHTAEGEQLSLFAKNP